MNNNWFWNTTEVLELVQKLEHKIDALQKEVAAIKDVELRLDHIELRLESIEHSTAENARVAVWASKYVEYAHSVVGRILSTLPYFSAADPPTLVDG